MPELSVIVCTIADRDDIDCLPSLENGSFQDFELIFRDDEGLSKARNEGIGEATADKIVFLDDDAIPANGYLSEASRSLEEYPIVGGKVVHPTDDVVARFSGHYDQGDEPKLTDHVVGCNMAFRREVFERVGYFDENISYGHEESDLIRRARAAGFEVLYNPAMVVEHRFADSVADLLVKMYRLGRADVYYDRKRGIPERRRIRQYIPLRRGNSLYGSIVASFSSLSRSVGRASAVVSGVPSHDPGHGVDHRSTSRSRERNDE